MARPTVVDRMTATVHIDLDAFENNVAHLVSLAAPAATWVAIKSNAYGHGMVELADNALKAGASGLAVLDVPAALSLRTHGVTATLFAWLHGAETDFAAAVAGGVDLGVSTFEQLDAIAASPGVGRVHLKIDTGLHRNGVSEAQWEAFCRRAHELESAGSIRVAGIWSHLADAGDESDAKALSRFDAAVAQSKAIGLSPEVLHIAASSAALRNPGSRYDVVRIGIAAYGISPFDDVDGEGLGLRPVLRLSASTDGGSVSAGWFDGIPQVSAASGAWISGGGTPLSVTAVHPRITEVAGDSLPPTVDIIGGEGPTMEQWAAWSNTIGDEIVTGIPSHVRRVFVRG
jgi:alanine racemase